MYFDRLCLYFSPKMYSKPCETWHGQSHVYPEEEFIENVMSTLRELY